MKTKIKDWSAEMACHIRVRIFELDKLVLDLSKVVALRLWSGPYNKFECYDDGGECCASGGGCDDVL